MVGAGIRVGYAGLSIVLRGSTLTRHTTAMRPDAITGMLQGLLWQWPLRPTIALISEIIVSPPVFPRFACPRGPVEGSSRCNQKARPNPWVRLSPPRATGPAQLVDQKGRAGRCFVRIYGRGRPLGAIPFVRAAFHKAPGIRLSVISPDRIFAATGHLISCLLRTGSVRPACSASSSRHGTTDNPPIRQRLRCRSLQGLTAHRLAFGNV